MQQVSIGRFLIVLLYGYAALGTLGAIFIADDLDFLRLPLYTYAGVPLVAFLAFCNWAYPPWAEKFPKTRVAIVAAIIGIFAWGNLLLLNAAGEGQASVAVNQKVGAGIANLDANRGPLGMIYRWRF